MAAKKWNQTKERDVETITQNGILKPRSGRRNHESNISGMCENDCAWSQAHRESCNGVVKLLRGPG